MEIKYIHTTDVHNVEAPSVVVPILLDEFKCNSVVDVGCGIGTWLKIFQECGINDFLGVDGDYVERDQLLISKDFYLAHDLNTLLNIERRFDIAICLEVAEHLNKKSSEILIQNLVELSDIVIFTAAIPGQGGQNHLNEQFPSYWILIFEKFGYKLGIDLRSEIWQNKKVDWWYQQNLMIFTKSDDSQEVGRLKNYIHPELYNIKLNEIESLKRKINDIYSGKISIVQSLKIFIKSLFRLNH